MELQFYKYHGTGNDFVLIDSREISLELSPEQVKFLCDRRFGIGSDGLMILKSNRDFDFEMVYYNSDGSRGAMCGNGGRCIVAFAKYLGMIKEKAHFFAPDGEHVAYIEENDLIKIKMIDVSGVQEERDFSFLYTGTLHYVKFVDNPDLIDIVQEGRKIRYSDQYKKEGTNVNFVSKSGNGIYVRTYERGVENETYSCGTGSTASAIAYYLRNKSIGSVIPVKTLGGYLEVSFNESGQHFTNVFLKGPAKLVYKGTIIF